MRCKIGLASLTLLFLFACNTIRVVPYEQLGALEKPQTVRVFYPSADGSIEAYVSRPRGKGSFPLVVLLHGHSLSGRGADQVLSSAELFADEICFASVAISLPGYGSTRSPRGPTEAITRQAVRDGLSLAKQLKWVDSRRIFLYGVSRGATVAAAMMTEVENVSGAALYAGAYDLGRLYRETPSFWVRKILNPNDDTSPKLLNLLNEGSKWRVPTLILHGEQDNLIPVNQSLLLRDQLRAAGTYHRLELFPDHGHFLPRAKVREQVVDFFKTIGAPACPPSKPSS